MKKMLLRMMLLAVALLTGVTSMNAETVNFDFTANEWNLPTGTTLARDKGYITAPIEKDGVSLVFKYGTASSLPYYILDPSWGVNDPQVRILKNNVMKVMAPEGKAITKITFETGTFNLAAEGLTDKTWEGNAAVVKFTASGTSQLNAMEVTFEDMNASTVIPTEPDEVVFIDFNDPTQHKEFNIVDSEVFTENLVLLDKAEGGESALTTTIPYTESTSATVSHNMLYYASGNVRLRVFNGTIKFETTADKIIKKIEITGTAFNSGNTINGESVTSRAELNAWEGNSNVAELAIAGQTLIYDITVTIVDKPIAAPEQVVVPVPVFDKQGGEFTDAEQVQVTVAEGLGLMYTTDGIDPNISNGVKTVNAATMAIYNELGGYPIRFDETTTIKAMAFDADGYTSEVVEATFTKKVVEVETIALTIDERAVEDGVGYATLFYGEKSLVVPAGVEAFAAKVDGNQVVPTTSYVSTDVIPAGVAVIVKGDPGDYEFEVADPTSSYVGIEPEENQLIGFDETTLVSTVVTDGKVYKLSLGGEDQKVGFFYGAAGGSAEFESEAHKAVLVVTDAQASAKGFFFSEDVTAINAVENAAQKGEIYNVQGQRVAKAVKGLYIIGGKKVLVK